MGACEHKFREIQLLVTEHRAKFPGDLERIVPSAADERVMGVEFTDDALSVSLRDGRIITVPFVWYPRLLDASPAQRKNWKIASGGYGLHWPDLDEDLSTEGLLRGAPAPKVHARAK
jgi:hypothetical protein